MNDYALTFASGFEASTMGYFKHAGRYKKIHYRYVKLSGFGLGR